MDRPAVQRAVFDSIQVWLGVPVNTLADATRWESIGIRAPDSLDETEMYLALERSLGVPLVGILKRIRDPQVVPGLTLGDTVDDLCRDLGVTPN